MKGSRGEWLSLISALATAVALLWLGMASNPITPDVGMWMQGLPPGPATGLPPELREVWRQARQDDRKYKTFAMDLMMSRTTPQDVSWRDTGYPQTNPWCALPSAHMEP